jgi:hypothetical protein
MTMGYGVRHLDGTSDDDAPTSSFYILYDELRRADGEHNDVSVIDDDTGWCITAFPSGLVIFQCLADGSAFHMRDVEKPQVIQMWMQLAQGALDEVRQFPWKKGFK